MNSICSLHTFFVYAPFSPISQISQTNVSQISKFSINFLNFLKFVFENFMKNSESSKYSENMLWCCCTLIGLFWKTQNWEVKLFGCQTENCLKIIWDFWMNFRVFSSVFGVSMSIYYPSFACLERVHYNVGRTMIMLWKWWRTR